MEKRNTSTQRQTNQSPYKNRWFLNSFQFVLCLIALFVYSSCSEDPFFKTSITNGKSNENPHAKYLLEWKKTKNHFTSRGGGNLSVSESLDFLKNGMNYLYCRPNDFFLESIVYLDTFAIAVSSGQIDEQDLVDLMDEIADFAGGYYYADTRTTKEPIMFDMNQVGSLSPSYVNIEVAFMMEAGDPIISDDSYPYEESWLYARWFGEDNPECNEEETMKTAPHLLERDLRKILVYRNQTTPFYLINPVAICFDPFGAECVSHHNLPPVGAPITQWYGYAELDNPNDATRDNILDYLLFLNTFYYENFDECLEPEEMNFYYESMKDLILDLLPSPAGNNVIGQIEVGWDRLIFQGIVQTIWHPMLVMTATKVTLDENHDTPLLLPTP